MLVYLLAAAAWSRAAGLVAATLALAAPRLFFDAQLAAFDAPIAAMWVAVVYAYWRALDERKWGWRTGVLFGLALATKHNAFFLPAVLAPHWLFVAWQRRRLPPLRPFVYMATLGLVVYLACWPWLWFDTVNRFREYVAFHVHHVYYNMEYFGRNYNKPPFPLSFPYVMEALTLPVTTLVLAARRRRRAGARLVARARHRADHRRRVDTTAPSTRAPRACSSASTRSSRWPSSPSRARPSSAPPSTSTPRFRFSRCSPATRCTPSPRAIAGKPRWLRARVRRARLSARRRRDLALAPLRAHPLQPPRRRPGRRRRPRHEPPVLGLLDARHPAVDRRARPPAARRSTGTTPTRRSSTCTCARGACAPMSATRRSRSRASRRATSPWSFTRSTSTNTNIGSGISTAPPARRWSSTTKASRS